MEAKAKPIHQLHEDALVKLRATREAWFPSAEALAVEQAAIEADRAINRMKASGRYQAERDLNAVRHEANYGGPCR